MSNVYIGTMVFSITAAIVTLAIFAVLVFYPSAINEYMFLVYTIMFGLVVIIIQSIVRIYMYERKIGNINKNVSMNLMTVDTCPDYFVRSADKNKRYTCRNNYTTPDKKYTYSVLAPSSTRPLASVDTSLWNAKPMSDVCKEFNTNATLYPYPWTDLKAKCDAYNMLLSA